MVQALDFISLSPCPFGRSHFPEALLRELIDGALRRLTVPHGVEWQRGGRVSGRGIWARHIGWRLRMGRANQQSERGEKDIRLHCQPSPVPGPVEQCEGATGSLAIVASDHGPSHPCGISQRIAIANDAPRGATSRHVDVPATHVYVIGSGSNRRWVFASGPLCRWTD